MLATKTKTTGLDTLKVLAMRIAPGQELVGTGLEACAKRTWYGDHYDRGPYLVYVKGRIESFLKAVQHPHHELGGGFQVWGFDSRSEADAFIRIAGMYENLSYWLIGLSRQYAMISEFPLVGHFVRFDRPRWSIQKQEEQIEAMRVLAQEMFSGHPDFAGRPDMSIVLTTSYIHETPSAGSGTRRNQDTYGEIHYRIFGIAEDATRYLASAIMVGAFEAWHFAKLH